MRIAGTIALVLSLATTARAEPQAPPERGFAIQPPDGWQPSSDIGDSLAQSLMAQRHYDGIPVDLGVDAWLGDDAALYVTWIHAREPIDDPELAARRAFDGLREAPGRASPRAGSAEMVSWRERVHDQLADGQLEWRHVSNETTTLARALIWVAADGALRQARAECVMPDDASAALRVACEGALASLEVTAAARGSLGALPGGGSLALSDTSDDAPMVLEVVPAPDPAPDPANAPPSLRPAIEGAVLYQDDSGDDGGDDGGSTVFVTLGIALLAIAAVMFVRARRAQEADRIDRREEQS